mgnify:CR=1 FL=1
MIEELGSLCEVSEVPIYEFKGKKPKIDEGAFVSPLAVLVGDVEVGEGSSIFPGAVIRGDIVKIKIGRYSNIQDNVVIHGGYIYDKGKYKGNIPVKIGDYVSVTHSAVIHGCIIEDVSMIGIGAKIFDGVKVGSGSIVGIGTVVLKGTIIPERSVVVGTPGRVIRKVSDDERAMIMDNALRYFELAKSMKGIIF